jgi:hypothetical protein
MGAIISSTKAPKKEKAGSGKVFAAECRKFITGSKSRDMIGSL